MTKEEAIAVLGNAKYELSNQVASKYCRAKYEAIDMAIKALEQQNSEDCVSRQAVLDKAELIELDDGQSFMCIDPEYVKSLPPATPTQNWIPVSERLPESEGLYLVSVKNDHLRQYSKTCWFNSHRNWFSRQDVIAWQPLPQPYEEKEGSENESIN